MTRKRLWQNFLNYILVGGGGRKSLMPFSGIFHRQRAWPRGIRYMFNAANRLLLLFFQHSVEDFSTIFQTALTDRVL